MVSLKSASRHKSHKNSVSLNLSSVLENLPLAVMSCELKNFTIDYVNEQSRALLDTLGSTLGIDPNQIIGTCVDVFHKRPEFQRQLLSDPKNLPHHAVIQLGEEYLDLNIVPYFNAQNQYTHAILSWNIVTDKVNADKQTKHLMQMIDRMPINVMTCELENFTINYVNQTSIDTLQKVEEYLPIKAKDLLGQTIDIFHKKPEHQRAMLRDPSNLPHQANIRIGPEVLSLNVSAIQDENGQYTGPMLTWSIISDNVRMAEQVTEVVDGLVNIANDMSSSSTELTDMSRNAKDMAASVSSAAEEMTASIKEISTQLTTATQITSNAVEEAEEVSRYVNQLSDTANQISNITEVIEGLADSTNLLALNATIEAARAGEAGKGFAVVASEVKDLASRTSKATTEIKQQISGILTVVDTVVKASEGFITTINRIDEISAQISAAVEEQTATAAEVSANINGVSDAANTTGIAAGKVSQMSSDMHGLSQRLSGEVDNFLESTS